MISVFRICSSECTRLSDMILDALSGAGRWHVIQPKTATAVIYAASSRALAQLEKLANANGGLPENQALVRIDLEPGASLLEAFADLGLQARWPEDEAYTRQFGMAWFESEQSLGLWVPSCVQPEEQNLLLNPRHAQFETHVRVVVEQAHFEFDPRLR